MKRTQIILDPIGIIHTPFHEIRNMPIQPLAAKGIKGIVEVFSEFSDGLADLSGFSHINLLYYFHKIDGFHLHVKPFMDNEDHGIFATKSPKRPNAIGISTVKLLNIKENILHVEMVDILDGTPLLDIKPFYERFDNRFDTRSGWLEKQGNTSVENLRSDERFK